VAGTALGDSDGMDVTKSLRPSPSIFAYCKQSKLQVVKGWIEAIT